MINLKNPLQKWKDDFERMANTCLEQAKEPLDIKDIPDGIKEEVDSEMQKAVFEGMATGYKMIISQIEVIIELGAKHNDLKDVLKLLKEQLTRKANEFSELLREKDSFKNGFYSGLKSSYVSAITHMKL